MHRLFWRIFAAFWLANAAFVVSVAWVAMLNYESERIPGLGITRMQAAMDEQLRRIAEEIESATFKDNERGRLIDSLRVAATLGPINYYALDSAGHRVDGNPVPVDVQAVLEGTATSRAFDHVRIREATSPTGVQWALVAHADDSLFRRVLYRRSSPFWAQWWIALAIIAVMSALLAWYVAEPLNRIRDSTRRFAEGDLDARVGRLAVGRSAEMTALGSEFDRMAERIKTLVDSNRRLVRDVSHELRSPLARVRVALELARDGDRELAQRSIDRIERECDRLEAMLSQALELSRLETSPATRTEPIALDELLEDVIANADYEGAPRGRRVRFDRRASIRIVGSHEALSSAFENIIRNALKYTADDSDIEVSLEALRDRLRVRVRDHGPGVAEDELPRIVEPFYRTDSARARSSGGTGLGLAIANSAVMRHGGQLIARNADGGGLEITIELPLPAQPEGRPSRQHQASSDKLAPAR